MAQSVERPTSAQVTISQFVSSSPVSGSVLTDRSEPGARFGFCVSLSLCPFNLCLFQSLSLSISLSVSFNLCLFQSLSLSKKIIYTI